MIALWSSVLVSTLSFTTWGFPGLGDGLIENSCADVRFGGFGAKRIGFGEFGKQVCADVGAGGGVLAGFLVEVLPIPL